MVDEKQSNGDNAPPSGGIDSERLKLDREKFEFEKTNEIEKRHLLKRQIRQAGWDNVWRVFGSALISGGIAAAVTIYGIQAEQATSARLAISESAANERAAENRRSEVAVNLLNSREVADSQLKGQMFSTLLANYLTERDEESKITVLAMLGMNFRDTVQLKPMFENLDRELRASPGYDLQKLYDAALMVSEDQLKEIRLAEEGSVCAEKLQLGQTIKSRCLPIVSIKFNGISDKTSGIIVQTNIKDGEILDTNRISEGNEFTVEYYDMPMTDYSIFGSGRNSMRFSIVLRGIDIDRNEADIAVAVLPVDSYSAQQEYKFDQILGDFLEASSPLVTDGSAHAAPEP